MKAKKKPVEHITLDALGVAVKNSLKTLSVSEPEGRSAGVLVSSARELVEKLRNEARVIP